MKKTIIILLTAFTFNLNAQNLYPVKLDNCNTSKFCLDCGDIKAGYIKKDFKKLEDKLRRVLDLEEISGLVKFQVLVDLNGKGCVLSHTDQSNNPITLKIIEELNKFNKWTPAIANGVKQERTSINLVFTIEDNNIWGQIERVDIDAFMKSFDRPYSPEIFNQGYVYKNENLSKYKITVWNSNNSNLPNNMTDYISIDKNGIIWLTTHRGLVTFNGTEFQNAEQNITEKGEYFSYTGLATDNSNTKWVFGTGNIYSFNDGKWTKYEESEVGITKGYKIINNPNTNELFFISEKGLTIYKNGKWSLINQENTPGLPSNRVYFAKRDSKNRIWIGTFNGSVMIDENNRVTNFENSETVLKGKCITSMDEDENGNIYFSLYELNPKADEKVNRDEGIAIRYADGTFKQFTTKNSGMPFNHTTCVLYDKKEKVLWISTDRAGLVRFDLKDGWENYHNENSDIPTSYISTMTFDNEGNLYLATRQGLVKIERK